MSVGVNGMDGVGGGGWDGGQRDEAQCGMAWYGSAWRSVAWRDGAGQCVDLDLDGREAAARRAVWSVGCVEEGKVGWVRWGGIRMVGWDRIGWDGMGGVVWGGSVNELERLASSATRSLTNLSNSTSLSAISRICRRATKEFFPNLSASFFSLRRLHHHFDITAGLGRERRMTLSSSSSVGW